MFERLVKQELYIFFVIPSFPHDPNPWSWYFMGIISAYTCNLEVYYKELKIKIAKQVS